jgi:hypothetical protein
LITLSARCLTYLEPLTLLREFKTNEGALQLLFLSNSPKKKLEE